MKKSAPITEKDIRKGKTRITIIKPADVSSGPGWSKELDRIVGKTLLVNNYIISKTPGIQLTGKMRKPQDLLLLFSSLCMSRIDSRWATIITNKPIGSRKGIDTDGKNIRRGSTVIISKPEDTQEYPYWVPRMDVLDGKEVRINKVLPNKQYIECSLKDIPLRYILNRKWTKRKD